MCDLHIILVKLHITNATWKTAQFKETKNKSWFPWEHQVAYPVSSSSLEDRCFCTCWFLFARNEGLYWTIADKRLIWSASTIIRHWLDAADAGIYRMIWIWADLLSRCWDCIWQVACYTAARISLWIWFFCHLKTGHNCGQNGYYNKSSFYIIVLWYTKNNHVIIVVIVVVFYMSGHQKRHPKGFPMLSVGLNHICFYGTHTVPCDRFHTKVTLLCVLT